MLKQALFAAAAAASLCLTAACTTQADNSQPAADAASQPKSPNKTHLKFYSPSEAVLQIGQMGTPAPVDQVASANKTDIPTDPAAKAMYDQDNAHHVEMFCSQTHRPLGNARVPFAGAGLVAGVVDWVIGEIGELVVDAVSAELDKEVKSYSATSTFEDDGFDFYATLSDNRGLSNAKAISCFEASLIEPSDPAKLDSPPTLVMDFVGSITFDPAKPQIVSLRPLRLFYQRMDPISHSNDGKYAVELKISADSITKDRSAGKLTKDVMDGSLVAVVIKPGELDGPNHFYRYYEPDKTPALTVPLPPWDYEKDGTAINSNYMTAKIVMTEVGDVPWLLAHADALISANKDAITKAIVTEAQKYSDAAIAPPAQAAPKSP